MTVTRVDRWLWAIRITPTRVASTDLCRGGHVQVNGSSAKPATLIHPGDKVIARVRERERILTVVHAIEKRVSAQVAAGCVIDDSPPPPPPTVRGQVPVRDRSTGRPTKKERRETDRLRGR